jgi:hypothetical protein
MASKAFNEEVIELLDGTEVELRPLPIGKMRKVMAIWLEHTSSVSKQYRDAAAASNPGKTEDSEADTEFDPEVYSALEAKLQTQQYDTLVKLTKFGLEGQLKGTKTDKQFTDYLEDTLDDKTIQRILLVTASLRIGEDSPNLPTPNPA